MDFFIDVPTPHDDDDDEDWQHYWNDNGNGNDTGWQQWRNYRPNTREEKERGRD